MCCNEKTPPRQDAVPDGAGNQLNNPKFVEKAPAKLVEETRAKLAAAQDKAAKIKESIAALG